MCSKLMKFSRHKLAGRRNAVSEFVAELDYASELVEELDVELDYALASFALAAETRFELIAVAWRVVVV